MYAVTVVFRIKPDHWDAFLPAMLTNARTSRAQEPGCHQFDVCTDPDEPNTVFLYELYDDRAAFDAHLESVHFRAFDAATAPMVADKRIRCFAQVHQ